MFYARGFHFRATVALYAMIAILITSAFAAALPKPAFPVPRSLAPGPAASPNSDSGDHRRRHKQVLVLGGGVAGILAARKLIRDEGIADVLIIEARDELGGRMRSTKFGHGSGGDGEVGGSFTVELGANWIQGTQESNGPANPILVLAEKHGVRTVDSDFNGSLSGSPSSESSQCFFLWRDTFLLMMNLFD
jgi:hypothetical protein